MRAIAACLDEVLRMGREAAQRQGTGGNLENRVGRAADNPAVPSAGLDGDVGIRVILRRSRLYRLRQPTRFRFPS